MSTIKRVLIYLVIVAYLCACASTREHVTAQKDDHVRSEGRAADVDRGTSAKALVTVFAVFVVVAVTAPELLLILVPAAEVARPIVPLVHSDHHNGYNKTEYKISHILVGTEEEAKAIAADLKQGKDFGTIAKEKSIDAGSSQNGGELGWGYIDIYPKSFADAVLKLKKGEISDPARTTSGWHIIKLEDTRDDNLPPGR